MLATLVRELRDFELAEDCVQDAFAAALAAWSRGVPERPGAWILTAARRRALDRRRSAALRRRRAAELEGRVRRVHEATGSGQGDGADPDPFGDDRLRLVFTCCHPALDRASQVALTLQTVAGLTAPEIARAFLVPESAMAQRLVRVKRKIRDAAIPYRVPPPELLPERLQGVLGVVYLVFNEGYAASSGDAYVRADLADEAIRLARLLRDLLPSEPEVLGLLALLLLHDARRAARTDPSGGLVTLDRQDRGLWDRERIAEGVAVLAAAARCTRPGPYQVQAAISAVHAAAPTAAATDWRAIVRLYDALLRTEDTPVVRLNRTVAVSYADGPAAALALVGALGEDGSLDAYAPFHAVRGDLLSRTGRGRDAALAFTRASELTTNAAERRHLLGRAAAARGGA